MQEPNSIIAWVWSGWTATWPSALPASIWAVWLLSWCIGAFFSGRTEKQVRTWDSRTYRFPILVGALLLTPWTAEMLGEKPLWQVSATATYILAALTAAAACSPGGRACISGACGQAPSRARKAIASSTPALTGWSGIRSIPD